MTSNLKTKLLLGAAGVALAMGASAAQAADVTPAVDTTISAAQTGDNGAAQAGDAAGNSANASVTFGAATITVTNTSTITGGNGSAGGTDANSDGGNTGGNGGAGVSIPAAQDGASASSHPTLTSSGAITGGNGGAGSAAGVANGAQAGGAGGAGGAGVNVDSNFADVTTSTGGTITGGNGANGGAANGAAAGGNGGAGAAGVTVASDTNTITVGANVTGGTGGNGATGTATGAGGAAGNGGAGITTTAGTGATITVNSGVTVAGGTAGTLGADGGGGAGAAGTQGAGIQLVGTAGVLSNSGTIAGGNSGAGIALDINAATASVTNTSTGTIGGAAHAGGAITVDGGTLTLLSNAGTIQSTSGIAVDANQAITTLTNTGTIQSTDASALDLAAAVGTFTNTSGTITSASTGAGNAALDISADITGGGNQTITGGTISNTRTADNNGVALQIAAQTGEIILSSVTVSSVGTGTNAGVAVDISGAATLRNTGGTITGQILDTGDVAITFVNTGTVNGAITLNGNAAHTITNTSGTITGAVTGGANTDNLNVNGGSITGAVDLAAGTNTIVLGGGTITGTVNGDGGVDTIQVTSSSSSITGAITLGAGVNVLDVNENFTTGGAITNAGGSMDADVAADKTLTLNHSVTGFRNLVVNAGGILYVNETNGAAVDGTGFNNAGRVEVAAGKTFTVDDVVTSTGTYDFVISDATTAGTMVISGDGDAVDLTGATTTASFVGTNFIASGTEIKVMDANGFAITSNVADATAITDDSFIYSVVQYRGDNGAIAAASDNTQIWYEITRASAASLATGSSRTGVAATLDALGVDGDATLDAIQGNLGSAATQADLDNVLESVTSSVDGGNVVGALTVSNSTANVTSGRLASLRDGSAGVAAGEITQGLKAWGQVFGTTGTQDERDGVDGFDVDTYGFAAGIDTETLAEDWVLGLAFSYADTDVDSENATSTETEIDTYQVTLYGDYDWDDRTYVSGQLGYAWGDNDTKRSNVGGVAGLNATGSFDSEQFIARMEVGRDYDAGQGTTVTPSLLVNYNHYDADSYTESGANGANLIVDSEALDVLEVGLGVDASWTVENADGTYLKPELRAGVRYDVLGEEVEATNTFTGGGAAFKTEGFDPAQTTFNVGAGVAYFTTDNWELTGNYDFEYKSDYDAHSAYLKAAYKF